VLIGAFVESQYGNVYSDDPKFIVENPRLEIEGKKEISSPWECPK